MKKITPLLIFVLFIFFTATLSANAEEKTWVTLESDIIQVKQIGQTLTISLNGSLAMPINGAGIVLDYDPACLQVSNYQAGSLLPNAVEFKQDNAGSFDITYYYQGVSQAIVGEGSIILVSFEAIALCDTTISASQDLITLDSVNEDWIAVGLMNVEYRNLVINLNTVPASETLLDENMLATDSISSTPEQILAEVSVEEAVQKPDSQSVASSQNNWHYPSNTSLILIALVLTIIVLLLRLRDSKKPKKTVRKKVQTSRSIRPSNQPILVEEKGNQQGSITALNRQRTLLGRHKICHVRVRNNHISRQHAEIIRRDGAYYLADVGSRNGTFLNESRVNAGYHPLHDGDRVRLGREAVYRFSEPYGRTVMYA